MRAWIRRSLWEPVPRDHRQDPRALRRRQAVTVATVVVGAALLAGLLRVEAGGPWFYVLTLALAGVWAAGAFASGPLHLGRIPGWRERDRLVRPVLAPVLLGLALVAVFTVGGLVAREVPWIADQVAPVVELTTEGPLLLLAVVTAVNGIAEELFFRGAAYAAIPRQPVLWTTVAYALATVATGNPMLVLAAALLGLVVGLERSASGGVLAPLLTHCTWSLSMLVLLPVLFG